MFAFDIYKGLECQPNVTIAEDFVLYNMISYEKFQEEKKKASEKYKSLGDSAHYFAGTKYLDAYVAGEWQDGHFIVKEAATMMNSEWGSVEGALRNALA